MVPQQIGRYEVKGTLGQGGMATVYHGYDPHFERDVAIKVLPREFLHDPTFRTRFEREARTIAALEHPAIVPVHDFGEEDGQPYLVMRMMNGGTLADRIEQGPLPLRDIVRITERIADALQAAHQAGIIHRDLKPSNILFDRRGNPYIADFGIAKVTEASAVLTGTGIVGTPAYMAPEMAQQGGLTPLVDVYALGITVFQMLTGRLPFAADTPAGMIMAHLAVPVPNPRAFQPDLPESVVWVIEQALAKEPTQRYQSTEQLAADLETAASGEIPQTTLHEPFEPDRQSKTLAVPEAAVPAETPRPRTPRVAATPAERGRPALGPVHFLGLGAGALVVTAAVLFGTGIIPLGRGAAPTEEPVQPPQETAQQPEVLPVANSTGEASPTPVSLQPLTQILFGSGEGMPAGQTEFAALPASQPLNTGDSIRTGDESALLLTFAPGISAEAHPNSQLSLARMVEAEGALSIEISQTAGTTYHFIHPIEGSLPVRYLVQTPVAAATATGTEFWVSESPDGWCFLPTEGSIEVDLGTPDGDVGDNYVAHARDGSGWLVTADGAVSPCQLDDERSPLTDGAVLLALAEPTVTPTSTRSAGAGDASGGSTGGSPECGNGACEAGENSDLCPADCVCIDNGTCEAGEGSGCRDCGSRAGGCGSPCSASSQCGADYACAGGVCWNATKCGSGGGSAGGSGGGSGGSGGGSGGGGGGSPPPPTCGDCGVTFDERLYCGTSEWCPSGCEWWVTLKDSCGNPCSEEFFDRCG